MIHLTTRAFVFNNFPAVTSLIAAFQNDTFDDDPNQFDPNDTRDWYYEMHDALDRKIEETDYTLEILNVDHQDKDSYVDALTVKIIDMLTQLGIAEVVFLAHLKLPFVGHNTDQKNKISQRLIEKLTSITGNKKYEEAFLMDDVRTDLPDLIEFAFWMQQFGGGCPEYLYFADTEGRLAFHICQHGYLHLTDFKCGDDHDLNKALKEDFVKVSCDRSLI